MDGVTSRYSQVLTKTGRQVEAHLAAGPHGEQRAQVSPGDLPEDRGVSADRERTAGGETHLTHQVVEVFKLRPVLSRTEPVSNHGVYR